MKTDMAGTRYSPLERSCTGLVRRQPLGRRAARATCRFAAFLGRVWRSEVAVWIVLVLTFAAAVATYCIWALTL